MGKGAAAGGLVLMLLVAGCNITQDPPFDPRQITRQERRQAEFVPTSPLYHLPTTMAYPFATEGAATQPTTQPETPSTGRSVTSEQVLRMPIQEIMQRAALHNKEVMVAGYDPAIAETRIIEYEAHYDPIFFANPKYDRQYDRTPGTVIEVPSPSSPQGVTPVVINVEKNNIWTAESGVKEYLPSGGQAQLSYQTVLSDYFPNRYQINNYWDNQLKLQLTQPLLREFGYEVNWARITIARNDQRISVLDFRSKLEDNINELEKDYWNLFETQREVEIQEELLARTRELAEVLYRQFVIGGQATHVEASQSSAQLRQREAILVRAKAHLRDLSDDIKRRMGDDTVRELQVTSDMEILPADAPVLEPVQFDLQDQMDTAMDNRLELGQQQLRVDSAQVAQKVALNGLYPKFDLVASVALQGLSTDFSKAVSDQFGSGHVVSSIGFQLEIPLGNREARAILRRAQLQRMQAATEYRRLVDEIAQDVKQSWREVDTDWNEIRANRQARYLQQDALMGIVQRREGGLPLTPEAVQLELQAQEQLAESERQEALAIANYNIALAKLEKSKGTILRYNNILMEQEKYPWNLPSTAPRPPKQH